jgi:hypothetical protein
MNMTGSSFSPMFALALAACVPSTQAESAATTGSGDSDGNPVVAETPVAPEPSYPADAATARLVITGPPESTVFIAPWGASAETKRTGEGFVVPGVLADAYKRGAAPQDVSTAPGTYVVAWSTRHITPETKAFYERSLKAPEVASATAGEGSQVEIRGFGASEIRVVDGALTLQTRDAPDVGTTFVLAGGSLLEVVKAQKVRLRPGESVELVPDLSSLNAANAAEAPHTAPAPASPPAPVTETTDATGSRAPKEREVYEGVSSRGWVVTYNPEFGSNLLFIHRELALGMLQDLLYYVEVGADGSWSVYDASTSSISGGTVRGPLEARIAEPPSVHPGRCNCR